MSAVKEPQPPLPQPRQQQPPPHVFLQTLNPMRGKMEWKPQPLDYDYKQEVARAAFADMLHDTERVSRDTFVAINQVYTVDSTLFWNSHQTQPLWVMNFLELHSLRVKNSLELRTT